jgi:NAD(P)H-hydrate epimerase
VRYLDLGFFARGSRDDDPGGSFVLTDHVLDPLRALRPATADKRTFGHLFVVSGSRTMPGAVLMAVESALVSGVGLVTAFVPESLAGSFAARVPEAMWVPMPETLDGGLALEGRGSVVARAARCTGLLAGPGLGRDRESLALITEILRAIDVPAVLDGDALQTDIVAAHYPGSESVKVLTPHAGEFERIAPGEDLRAAVQRLKATIALKGVPTRICVGGVLQPTSSQALYYSPFGGPVLSRGGSGDVLAGLVAGQLAAGASPLEAAARGVVWHGLAADRLARAQGQTSARVTHLIPHLSAVLQEKTVAGIADPGPASTRPATA